LGDLPPRLNLGLVVVLGAGFGGEGQGDIVALGLAEDDLGLVDGVDVIHELGNVEALLFLDVLADDLGDGDVVGHAVLDGLRSSELNLNVKWDGDEWHLVGLGLVFLATVLVLAGAIVGLAVTGWSAGGDLHGLGLGLISDLGGGGSQSLLDRLVVVGADLPWLHPVGLLADGSDLLITVLVVDHFLDGQGDWGHLAGEGWDADLSVDAGVGVSAVNLWFITVTTAGVSSHQGWQEE